MEKKKEVETFFSSFLLEEATHRVSHAMEQGRPEDLFELLEELGKGSYGSVYKVRRLPDPPNTRLVYSDLPCTMREKETGGKGVGGHLYLFFFSNVFFFFFFFFILRSLCFFVPFESNLLRILLSPPRTHARTRARFILLSLTHTHAPFSRYSARPFLPIPPTTQTNDEYRPVTGPAAPSWR